MTSRLASWELIHIGNAALCTVAYGAAYNDWYAPCWCGTWRDPDRDNVRTLGRWVTRFITVFVLCLISSSVLGVSCLISKAVRIINAVKVTPLSLA